jgi:hypothetical protein
MLHIFACLIKFKRFRVFKDFKHINVYCLYNLLQINNKIVILENCKLNNLKKSAIANRSLYIYILNYTKPSINC